MFLECQFATHRHRVGHRRLHRLPPQSREPTDRAGPLAASWPRSSFSSCCKPGASRNSRRAMMRHDLRAPSSALVMFWVVAATHFSWERVWPRPRLPRQGLAGRARCGAVRPVVAGDDRNGGPGRRGSPRAAPHHPARPGLGAADPDRPGRADLAVRLRRAGGRRIWRWTSNGDVDAIRWRRPSGPFRSAGSQAAVLRLRHHRHCSA